MKEYSLVVAEKPDAAKKLAIALGWKNPQNQASTAPFEIPSGFDGKGYLVYSALGHLFEIGDTQLDRSVFPVFDLSWYPKSQKRIGKVARSKDVGSWVARRIGMFEALAENAKTIINACDYDIEGETIGSNIVRLACRKVRTQTFRAKFSTLTEEEIRTAFTNLSQDSGLSASAGSMRHAVDFLWGVNLSRALTDIATRGSKEYTQVAIGRVQGPTLSFIVEREIDISSHVPIPSWTIFCTLQSGDTTFEATHHASPFANLLNAEALLHKVKTSESGTVISIKKNQINTPPRYPFDIGNLQREAFHIYSISPFETLRLAERLYLKGLISYPRTDSQKLPASIGPHRILSKLSGDPCYATVVNQLLTEPHRSSPWEGPQDDPAHPAVFPTGIVPKFLSSEENKIYDLVVRRFLNAFATDAKAEKTICSFDVANEQFIYSWENLISPGWTKYYPFRRQAVIGIKLELTVGSKVKVQGMRNETYYSSAPARFSEASIIAKMESEGVGTKATRAEVVATLLGRKLVSKSKKELLPEENALNLITVMHLICPEIISTQMTKSLESNIAQVESGQDKVSILIEELLTLRSAIRKLVMAEETHAWSRQGIGWDQSKILGPCPSCKNGNLIAIKSPRTGKRFIRCTNAEGGCKASSPLPSRGKLLISGDSCKSCSWPLVTRLYFRQNRNESKKTCSNYFCSARKRLY